VEWEPVQGRDAFLGAPPAGTGSKPSIEGRDTLAWAMAELVPKQKPPKKRHWWWPKWMTWKRAVALVIVDLILGHLLWGYVFKANPGAAQRAVNSTISDVAHHNWQGAYDSLCRDDQAQIDESDMAAAGSAALEQFGLGIARWTITSARTVHQSLGPVKLPAVQVGGQLYPVTGEPSAYTVVVVHELNGWHVCMSAGGFSMLGYTEPLGEGFTP
jgi:hypothetical protein